MRLHALRLQHFRQHADTVLTFGPGITGIIGPNGAGKTTILEAIAWALYGMDAARGKRDAIKSMRAPAKASVRVELEFDLAGHRYRVVRGLTSAEVYLDGGAAPVANSISAANDFIARRLGMTRAEFFNTYFTGQKELAVMASLGPTERAQFLSRVLGYERLRDAQDAARQRRRELAAELLGVEQALRPAEEVASALASAQDALATAQREASDAARRTTVAAAALLDAAAAWEVAQGERAAHRQAAEDLRLREAALQAAGREATRLAALVDEARAAVAARDALTARLAPLAALQAERERLDALAVAEGRRSAALRTVAETGEELTRKQERRALVVTAPALEETLQAQLEAARSAQAEAEQRFERAQTDWVRDKQEAETRRDALRAQFTELRDQRERLVSAGEAGLCPTCQRPIGANYRTLLETLDQQLDTVRVDGQYWKGRVGQLAERPAALAALEQERREAAEAVQQLDRKLDRTRRATQELDELTREVARLEARMADARAELATLPEGYDAARYAVVRTELEALQPLAAQSARLSAVADQLAAREAEGLAAREAASAQQAAVDVLRAQVAAGAADEPRWTALEATLTAARHEDRAAAVAATAASAARAAAAQAVATAEAAVAERERLVTRRQALARERRLHEELDRAYADLRTDLNGAVRPELSELASRFLAVLTDGRYDEFELDDQYQLVVVEDGLPKPVISGGEEDLANLVLRLAISQMIAERAGQAFSLLILDEIFGSLDDARRQNVVELLRRLGDRFEQVVLITHIESVRDGCDQVLAVSYDARAGRAVVTAGEAAPPLAAEVA